MMKESKGRASGKCILIGEHFVVTGAPALAFPIADLWCEVTVQPATHPYYEAQFPGHEDPEVVENFMARAVYAAAQSLRIDISGQAFSVKSRSNFPVSHGFGSSASFAIALSRAFARYRDTISTEKTDLAELVRSAGAVEKIFHGQPSGIDAAAILSERPIRFESGHIVREVNNHAVDIVALDGGPREVSGKQIARIAQFRAEHPEQWSAMCVAMSDLVSQAEKGLEDGDAASVAAPVRRAQGLLADLGLTTPQIDELIARGIRLGALAGKVSGAGAGGAVILIAALGDGARLAEALKQEGLPVMAVLGGRPR